MPTNPYFNHFQNIPEQNLHQDLIIESIKNFGIDVYYLPRTLVNLDKLYLEDTISEFNSSFLVEMYVKSVDGFEGDGDFISRFGLEIRDQVTFSIARRRWENLEILDYVRPKEGDLIFFPLNKKLYEIKFVEHESIFYQFGKLPIYDLTCELFQYDDQTIDTGIDDIDQIEEKYSYVSEYKYLIGNTAIISADISDYRISKINILDYGSGYFYNPTVTITDPDLSPTTATATAIVSNRSLTGFIITNFGAYYVEDPTIIIDSPGDPITATATSSLISNSVSSVSVTHPGSFYNNNPTIIVNPPTTDPITATASAIMTSNSFSGTNYISSIVLGNSGTYYKDVPNVTIQDTIQIPSNWTTDSKFGNYSYQFSKSNNNDQILRKFRSDYSSNINYGGNFSFWFKYDQNLHTNSGISDVSIFEFKNENQIQSVISILNTNGEIKFTTYDSANQLYHYPSCPATDILDGNWHFLQFIKSRSGFNLTYLKIIIDSNEVVNYTAPFNGVWTDEWFTNYNSFTGNGGIILKNSGSKGFIVDDIYYNGTNFNSLNTPTTSRDYIIDIDDSYKINYEGFEKKEAVATATVENGIITSISLTENGEMYSSVPLISIDSPTGTSNDFKAIMSPVISDGILQSINIDYGGNFYNSAPTITISDPTGNYNDFENINATATSSYNSSRGIVDKINIVNSGKFYYTNPTVTISNPTGLAQDYKASFTTEMYANGSLKLINIDNSGYGYSSPPTLTIDAPKINILKGDIVIGNDSGLKGEVSFKDSTTIKIINSGGSFNDNEFIKTSDGNSVRVYDQTDEQNFINDELATNDTIEKEADSIIDFSETNPFSETNY